MPSLSEGPTRAKYPLRRESRSPWFVRLSRTSGLTPRVRAALNSAAWTTSCRSPTTGSSGISTRSRSWGRTERSTGTAVPPSTRPASSRRSSTGKKGGYYRISPLEEDWTSKQLYFPDTNVLITRFLTPGGVGELQGFMPIARTGAERHRHQLIRRVVGVRGAIRFRVDLQPRFNYARDS